MICPKCKQPGTCIIGNFFTGCGCGKEEAPRQEEKIGYVALPVGLVPSDCSSILLSRSLEGARRSKMFFSSLGYNTKIHKVSYEGKEIIYPDPDLIEVDDPKILEEVE